jgi:hypothetical protein
MYEFKPMAEVIKVAFADTRKMLAYCDYIASIIQKNLKAVDTTSEKILSSVGSVKYDVSLEGNFLSTKKTIEVEDRNGKKYLITVEELNGN